MGSIGHIWGNIQRTYRERFWTKGTHIFPYRKSKLRGSQLMSWLKLRLPWEKKKFTGGSCRMPCGLPTRQTPKTKKNRWGPFFGKKTSVTPNWSEKYLTLQIHPVFAFKVEFRSMTIIFQKSNLETLTSTFQIKELYIYLEPVNVLYFGVGTLQKKAFSNQNKGHLGSRYLNKIECYQYIV